MQNFEIYIKSVLKQHTGGSGRINKEATDLLNFILNRLAQDIIQESNHLIRPFSVNNSTSGNKETISSREIQTSVRLLLPGELAKHAVSQATKAVTKFTASTNTGSHSQKGGLLFSVSKCKSLLEAHKLGAKTRIGGTTAVYLSAVLEYIASEIVELSYAQAQLEKMVTISPVMMKTAIVEDNELAVLMLKLNILLPGNANGGNNKNSGTNEKFFKALTYSNFGNRYY